MGRFGIGQAIKRCEDQRLLRGRGRSHEDVNLPGQTHAVLVRSMHAHARIVAIEASAALRAPGVLAGFAGADLTRGRSGCDADDAQASRGRRARADDRGRAAGDRSYARRGRGNGGGRHGRMHVALAAAVTVFPLVGPVIVTGLLAGAIVGATAGAAIGKALENHLTEGLRLRCSGSTLAP